MNGMEDKTHAHPRCPHLSFPLRMRLNTFVRASSFLKCPSGYSLMKLDHYCTIVVPLIKEHKHLVCNTNSGNH